MNSPSRATPLGPPKPLRAPADSGTSPPQALASAFSNTLRLLFNPFETRRWVKLSVVCLFLGGGTSSAAFHWSLGALPSEIGIRDTLLRLREYFAQHHWLIWLAAASGLGLGLVWFYLRALCRFVLVDAIVRREIQIRRAVLGLRHQAHSYFFWLLGALVVAGAVLGAGVLAALPFLQSAAAVRPRTPALTILLVSILLGEVLVGLLVALFIALTDDLGVPIMYAERVPLLAAWRRLWENARAETAIFALYILLRFVISVGVGVAVLFFLFPALVALFSAAVIVGALVVLGLQLVGVVWVWNALTLILASLALLLLMILLLMLLSLAGMPGQVLLQDFGVCFIAPRVPALEALRRISQLIRNRR